MDAPKPTINKAIIAQTQMIASSQRIQQAEKNIRDINQKIKILSQGNNEIQLNSVKENRSEWTRVYEYCEHFEDVEDLKDKVGKEMSQRDDMIQQSHNAMGHNHDHSEERKFFSLPEVEKIRYCERYRVIGNALFSEGYFDKAAEQYRISISYYEYCFPPDNDQQAALDHQRLTNLCNLSLCYLRLKLYREAIDTASLVIRDKNNLSKQYHWKAYFRRATAHTALDDFENASLDLKTSLELMPNHPEIIMALDNLKTLVRCATKMEKDMATQMFNVNASKSINKDNSLFIKTSETANQIPGVFMNPAIPLEPRR